MVTFEVFEESVKSHQALVDVIKSHSDEFGVCKLSQTEIARLLGKSQAWVSEAIKRINREKVCIVNSHEGYILNFDNILTEGTFYEILRAMYYMAHNPEAYFENEKTVACVLNINRNTLQAAKAYIHAAKEI